MKIIRISFLSVLLWASFSVQASNRDNWNRFSNVGAYGLVGVSLALPAYNRDWEGFKQAGFSVVTASGIGLIGKSTVNEERPDLSSNDSFPSNHTANSFAAATTLNLRYGWQVGFPAYAVATLVGVSRVEANRHHWNDVIVGALIGSFSGWYFTDAVNDNVRIVPWGGSKEAGVTLSINYR